jgi:serine-type D-Ala-D-Ala carboxypeptidase/endopeptidase (penicillin-binding protein 4)
MSVSGTGRIRAFFASLARGLALVLVAIVAAAVLVPIYRSGDLNWMWCANSCQDAVSPPSSLKALSPAAAHVTDVGSGAISASALQAAVAGALANSALGSYGFVALDGRDGTILDRAGSTSTSAEAAAKQALTPASTTKVLTSFAALNAVGSQTQFETSVYASGQTLILRGGGDPFLTDNPSAESYAPASLAQLAARTAARYAGKQIQLEYDASLFEAPDFNPSWPSTYRSDDVVTPITALWIDPPSTGLARSSNPAYDAAVAFANQLRAAGVDVVGNISAAKVPNEAQRVAEVKSATAAQIVSQLLLTSDNEAAEVMARQAALASGLPASFAGGVEAIQAELKAAGIDTEGLVLKDGSGLSRDDKISALTLARTVYTATLSSNTAAIADGLPIAGFDGSLSDRLSNVAGLVRSKTGTLSEVHALAGIVTLSGGRPVVFAVISNAPDDQAALAGIDSVASAIAQCACSD